MFAIAQTGAPGRAILVRRIQVDDGGNRVARIGKQGKLMNVKIRILAGMPSMSVLMPLALLPVQSFAESPAQQDRLSQGLPRIEGFNADEVRRIEPGAELGFTVYGTPGGRATLNIAGAKRDLRLVEVAAGQYDGTYTINGRDKIAARSPVTANLRVGNQIASVVLDDALQVGIGYHRQKSMPGAQP